MRLMMVVANWRLTDDGLATSYWQSMVTDYWRLAGDQLVTDGDDYW
jgi:hypothetical protein